MAEQLDRDTKLRVAQYARVLSVHIRTVLRAVTGEDNPSDWAPDDLAISKVARAFGIKPTNLIAALHGRVKLIDTTAAAKLVNGGVSVRRFHQMRERREVPAPAICHGRIVRYFDSDFDL